MLRDTVAFQPILGWQMTYRKKEVSLEDKKAYSLPSSLSRSSLKRYLRTSRCKMSALDVCDIARFIVLQTCSRRLCQQWCIKTNNKLTANHLGPTANRHTQCNNSNMRFLSEDNLSIEFVIFAACVDKQRYTMFVNWFGATSVAFEAEDTCNLDVT